MKNVKFGKWSGLAAVITGGLILSASSAFAADVILSGSVGAITTVTTTTAQGLGTFLGSAGLTDFAVTTATEKNNVTAGYKITVSSANAAAATSGSRDVSKLINAANSGTPITYTMKYGGTDVALVATTGAFTIDRTTTVNTPDGVEKILTVSTSAATGALAGTYADTITLSVVAD